MSTHGPAYDEKKDGSRLRQQRDKIKTLMLDGEWRSLSEVAHTLRFPEASISAQLRHLRKSEFGGFIVEKRRRDRAPGTWEYHVTDPQLSFDSEGQGSFLLPITKPAMWGH